VNEEERQLLLPAVAGVDHLVAFHAVVTIAKAVMPLFAELSTWFPFILVYRGLTMRQGHAHHVRAPVAKRFCRAGGQQCKV